MPVVNISDAEWEVMQVVWELRRATAADVIERLTPKNSWSHRTVRTLLARLVDKGALATEENGNRYIYKAVLSRGRCVREAGRSFLDKVFGGDPTELLVHFVQNSRISADEAAQLKRLLDEKLTREE
jgi:BlaI family penicillinase repressor